MSTLLKVKTFCPNSNKTIPSDEDIEKLFNAPVSIIYIYYQMKKGRCAVLAIDE